MFCVKEAWAVLSVNWEAVIALCALFLAVWQGAIQRKHNMLSSAPHLTFEGVTQNFPPQIRLTMTNHGVGPAFINSVVVTLDGIEQDMHVDGAWRKIAMELNLKILWGGGKSFNHGDALAAGQTSEIYIFKTCENKDELLDLVKVTTQLARIGIEVKYRCAYNKKYELRINRR